MSCFLEVRTLFISDSIRRCGFRDNHDLPRQECLQNSFTESLVIHRTNPPKREREREGIKFQLVTLENFITFQANLNYTRKFSSILFSLFFPSFFSTNAVGLIHVRERREKSGKVEFFREIRQKSGIFI